MSCVVAVRTRAGFASNASRLQTILCKKVRRNRVEATEMQNCSIKNSAMVINVIYMMKKAPEGNLGNHL